MVIMTTLYLTIAMMGSSAALEGLDVKKRYKKCTNGCWEACTGGGPVFKWSPPVIGGGTGVDTVTMDTCKK